ncbi:MAG: hypothetical protein ACOC1G_02080 [Phycisphaeraceae bacterium]
MIQRYHDYTIVTRPSDRGQDAPCVVFEGDSDETVGEFESLEAARAALDKRVENARRNGNG